MPSEARNRLFDKLDEVVDNLVIDDKYQEICSFQQGVCSEDFDIENMTVDSIGIWNKKFDQALYRLLKTAKPA